MNTHRTLHKKAYLIFMMMLGLSLGSLTACSSGNNNVETTNTSEITMVSSDTTKTASTKTDENTQKIEPVNKHANLNYQSKKFHSNNKMVLLDSKTSKVSIPMIKQEYLYKDVSKLISNKGKPDYFLREINSGVLRYTINNCPVIFFVVREKQSNRIDNIKSVCENEERTE